jgi:threonine synthase
MAYELFEQLAGEMPEVVLYPTGMWKAIGEMRALGWDAKMPRFVSVQAAGCAPVVKGFFDGANRTEPWPSPETKAYGLRVPSPVGGFICLRALRESNGTAVAVPEVEIEPATRALASKTGIDVCPEGGAAWAALARLRESGWIKPGHRVVVFNTGTGLKYR